MNLEGVLPVSFGCFSLGKFLNDLGDIKALALAFHLNIILPISN